MIMIGSAVLLALILIAIAVVIFQNDPPSDPDNHD